jgi:GT2 family glycosyltransferase
VTPPQVQVAVSTYRRPELLRRLLHALEQQTIGVDRFEVVVHDDASGDDTQQVLRERTPLRLTVLRADRNLGPAAGRDRAWRAGTAPVVAFTDDDCRPTPQWLEQGLAAMQDAGRAVVVGRTAPDPEQEHLLVDFSRTLRVDDAVFAPTCNVFYRRADLEAVDGFDTRFAHPGGEDTDLALRVEAAGTPRTFAAAALVHHEVRASDLRVALRDVLRWVDVPLLYRKHPGARASTLTAGVFWKPSHPPAVLLLAGVLLALARRSPAPLLLAAPWVRFRTTVWPVARGPRRRWALLPGALAVDALEVAVMARGSVRHRTVVL